MTTPPSNRPKIVVFGAYGPSLVNFRGPMMRTLIDRGWDVIAIAGDFSVEDQDKVRILGASPIAIPIERTGQSIIADLRLCWHMIGVLRRLKPSAIITYTSKPVIYGTLAAWLARVPTRIPMITGLGTAFTEQAAAANPTLLKIMTLLYAVAIRRASHVLFQNPDDQAEFKARRILPRSVPSSLINGSGVDMQHYQKADLPAGAPHFLMIARFLRAKGVAEYAAAAKQIRARYPDAKCSLLGWLDEGPDSVTADELAQWEQDGLTILPRTHDVRPAITNASVYVLPSFYREGTPRSVLEAMSMGRPIITTDAPGCRETVINGKNGFLIPPRDANALAAAMEEFCADDLLTQQMGAASHALCTEKFEVGKVNDQIISQLPDAATLQERG